MSILLFLRIIEFLAEKENLIKEKEARIAYLEGYIDSFNKLKND